MMTGKVIIQQYMFLYVDIIASRSYRWLAEGGAALIDEPAGRSRSAVSCRRADAGDCARPLCRRQEPADRQPARPHRPALVCAGRAVPRSGATADRARPLHFPHAVQPGRAAGGSRRAALDGSPVETDGRKIWRRFAENYHLFRGTPTRLWLDHVLSDLFGIDEPLGASNGRPPLRHDRRAACRATAIRPRALFERFNIEVDRHHRRRARRSGVAPDDPRQRLDAAASSPPIGPTPSSIPTSRALPPISTGSARSPAATPAVGRAISTRIASGAPSSRNSARPRPIMAIRPPKPPISPTPRPKSCSTASGAARRTSARSGCSAPRC